MFDSANVSDCTLLKMDCEGAEMEILEKASDQLLARISAICFEYHLDTYAKEHLTQLQNRLEAIGFLCKVQPTTYTLGIFYGINRIRIPRYD